MITIFCQFKVWKYSFHKWGCFTLYKMLLVSGWGCSPRPITSLAIYIQHETNRTCHQPRPSFAWILPICNIIFPIIDQYRYFFTSNDDEVMIVKCSLFFSNTNTEIWSNKRSMGPYIAKIFFLLVDEGFWLYWCLLQK